MAGHIKIKFHHSHHVNVAEAWNWLRRSEDTRALFLEYFKDGMSPSAARNYHESLILAEGQVEELANSQRNPPNMWIYHLHEMWRKEHFGDVNCGPEFLKILTSKSKHYMDQGCSVSVSTDPLVVVLRTPIMQRALQSLEHPCSFFIDSSASCDQLNSTITIILVTSKAGAIPVAVAVHECQTIENYIQVFQAIKTLCGVQMEDKIVNFMTDDSTALKTALEYAFPGKRQLLCLFHVLQAMWRWLWSAKHGISKADRKSMMSMFSGVLYARSSDAFSVNLRKLNDSVPCKNYPNFLSHVDKMVERKKEWCLAFRQDVQNAGHNTNNYAEATFRVLKDIILCRLKAFNAIALLDFSVNVMDNYYCKRLLDVAFGRMKKAHLLFQKYLDKGQKVLEKCKVEECGQLFSVQSEKDSSKFYEVTENFCACENGLQGAFCKHQAAVHLKFGKLFPNAPEVSRSDRKTLMRIALGYVNDFFLRSMKDENDDVNMPIADFQAMPSQSATIHNAEISTSTSEHNSEQILVDFSSEMERFSKMISENRSDSSLMDAVQKFVEKSKKVQTVSQLNSYLRTSRFTNLSRKIKVQPTSIARRRVGASKSASKQRCGRPLKTHPLPPKRQRLLSLNVSLNQPNAKSHGEGH